MSAALSIKNLLSSTTIESLLSQKGVTSDRLVSVNSTATLSDALKLMNENMIVSIPIIDEDKCVGVLDNVDVLNYLSKQFENIREWISTSEASVEEVLSGIRVTEALDFSSGDPMVVTGEGATAESIMKFLTSGWSHRCIVKTKDGYGIISQFDIVKLLAEAIKNNKELYDACDAIILMERLNSRSISDETVSIGSTENIFQALERMVEKKVPALAVVDVMEDGKIIGNFSAADLLNVEYGQFKEFSLSIGEFLSKYSPISLNPVTIEADGTTLAGAITLFGILGVHRLWIVDSGSETSFPVGVVTLTDMLKMISLM